MIKTTEELYELAEFSPNEGQDLLVRHYGSAVCGLAGAGAGKTQTIKIKMLHMQTVMGIDPTSIVALVYTKEGKKSLVQQYEELCTKLGVVPKIEIKTFHGFYLNLVQKFRPELSIIDEEEMSRILFMCMRKHIKSTNRDDLYEIFTGLLTYINNRMLRTKREVMSTPEFITSELVYAELKNAVDEYRNYKKEKNVIDYDDMQVIALDLLRNVPEVKEYVHSTYKWIIIDEYQDVAKIQVEVIKESLEDINKLIVIGDDDQTIYTWRGSDPDYILNMPIYFPGTRIITIGINYRCPKNILDPFVNSIKLNAGRLPKEITAYKDGGELKVCPASGNLHCSRLIADDILKKLSSNPEDYGRLNEYAVLYRTNRQPIFIVDMLLRESIPIRLSNDRDILYNNFIVKDLQDIVMLACNPCDASLFAKLGKKLLNLTKNNIDAMVHRMNGAVQWQKLVPAMDSNIVAVMKMFSDVYNALEEGLTFDKIIDIIMNVYYTHLEMLARVKNEPISEFFDIIKYVKDICASSNMTYVAFDVYLGNAKKLVRDNQKSLNTVNIVTMFKAKGLEYENVYMLDDSDNHCPDFNRIQRMRDRNFSESYISSYITQERNLHYVAGTRAKLYLMITFNVSYPSRFLIETGLLDDFEVSETDIQKFKCYASSLNYANVSAGDYLLTPSDNELDSIEDLEEAFKVSQVI